MATTANSGMKKVLLRGMAESALTNEQITRQRVGALEERLGRAELFLFNDENVYAKLSRGFWGRLRWLFTGK
jgi:hypothetical protein